MTRLQNSDKPDVFCYLLILINLLLEKQQEQQVERMIKETDFLDFLFIFFQQ